MSNLPPALAARLAKRGLLAGNSTKNTPRAKPEPEIKFEEQEEVIAEDYDDLNKPESSFYIPTFDSKICETIPGCPNKYNIYHNCTGYCSKRYADVPDMPSKLIRKKFARLLKKYPINESVWEQVYEPGLKTYYFWNIQTDQVSWLPPSHPDAKITLPAEKLRKLLREDITTNNSGDEEENDNKSNDSNEDADSDDDDSDDFDESSSSEESEKEIIPPPKRQRRQEISRRNDLDPMDPAAYSNIPRGKWSDGLRNSNDD